MAGRFERLSDEQWKYFDDLITCKERKVGQALKAIIQAAKSSACDPVAAVTFALNKLGAHQYRARPQFANAPS